MIQEKTEIYKALVQFHSSCPAIPKSGYNSYQQNRYATLADIVGTVQPLLLDLGVIIIQQVVYEERQTLLQTLLVHAESGQELRSEIPMPTHGQGEETLVNGQSTKSVPIAYNSQHVGSFITYMRRYVLCGMLSLILEEDEDGNSSSAPRQVQHQQNAATPVAKSGDFISEGQLRRYHAIANANNWNEEQQKELVTGQYGIQKREEIPWRTYDEIISKLQQGPAVLQG